MLAWYKVIERNMTCEELAMGYMDNALGSLWESFSLFVSHTVHLYGQKIEPAGGRFGDRRKHRRHVLHFVQLGRPDEVLQYSHIFRRIDLLPSDRLLIGDLRVQS